jgi:hypothetical protein
MEISTCTSPPTRREAIAANARTKILFQLSPEDAAALERLGAHDLAQTAAVRLRRQGETGPAASHAQEKPLRAIPDG